MLTLDNLLLTPQLMIISLISGSIYATAGVGLALAYGSFRILNFAHGHTIMVASYIFYWLHIVLQNSILVSLILLLLLSIPISFLFIKIFIEPFAKIHTILVLVTTLALSIMLESLITVIFGVNVLSLSTNFSKSINIFNAYITTCQIWIIIGAIVTLSLLWFVSKFTNLGIRLRALTESSQFLSALGINENFLATLSFTTGVFFAFISGVALGFETNINPTMCSTLMLKAFAAMIIGGLGNPRGAIFGGFFLAFIENFSIGLDFWGFSLSASYKDSFAFVIILAVLLIKPLGLFAIKDRAA